jgi:RNA polymerase-binding transcription factor DksA
MTDNEIAKMRARLEARLNSLHGRITEISDTLQEPQDDDFEEQAADLDDDYVLESLSHAARTEGQLIVAALRRIEEGTYGTCVDCGEKIAERRLEAIPEAERCLICAQKAAKR